MPYYFFDVRDGDNDLSVDYEGAELLDLDMAKAFASGIASTFKPTSTSAELNRVIVRDGAGTIVSVATFGRH